MTVTYMNGSTPVPVTIMTNSLGVYTTTVLLGQVSIVVNGATVTSPFKDIIFLVFGSGDYETTTDNEYDWQWTVTEIDDQGTATLEMKLNGLLVTSNGKDYEYRFDSSRASDARP